MDRASLSRWLKDAALESGFSMAGVAAAATPQRLDRFDEWLRRGYAGEMEYLAARRDAYADVNLVLAGVRSVVMLAMNYRTHEPAALAPGQGRVSRYAWGDRDYHEVIRERLHHLADRLRQRVPTARTRGIVDTAPLLEREFAQRAGLGWIGKNTLLLNRQQGSWFFLAALLTDLDLEPDAPHETDHCGTCRACLDACPTDAFVQPFVLDARRCISYATIEQGSLPSEEMRSGLGNWVFGCDVCQDVCPWNHRAPETNESAFAPLDGLNPVDLAELLALDDISFRQRFRRSPLWRPSRAGVLRSAAFALGNHPCEAGLTALVCALDDVEEQVRAAAAWALGRYHDPLAIAALQKRRAVETSIVVSGEIAASLAAGLQLPRSDSPQC